MVLVNQLVYPRYWMTCLVRTTPVGLDLTEARALACNNKIDANSNSF